MARILVIDDEANVRLMIRLSLQHAGHAVDTAGDGPEGLVKFGDGAGWDLVLIDQRMPGMEGLDVLREIKSRAPKAKAVMISAFGTIDLAVEAMRSGATDFLRKPFTADVLRGAIATALDKRSALAVTERTSSTTYAFTTVNGFRIERQSESLMEESGEKQFSFLVRNPDGDAANCRVHLQPRVIEVAKQEVSRMDRRSEPISDRFWEAFAEECLANYVWQNASVPPDSFLRVEDLAAAQRRWIGAVVASRTK